MGKHRHTSGSGVGSRLVPSLIAAALIVAGAFGVGLIAGVVLPEPSHPAGTPITLPSEPPGPPSDAGDVLAGAEATAVARPSQTTVPTPSSATGGGSPTQSPELAPSPAPVLDPSLSTAPTTTPAPTQSISTPGRARHHGRPWLRPRHR